MSKEYTCQLTHFSVWILYITQPTNSKMQNGLHSRNIHQLAPLPFFLEWLQFLLTRVQLFLARVFACMSTMLHLIDNCVALVPIFSHYGMYKKIEEPRPSTLDSLFVHKLVTSSVYYYHTTYVMGLTFREWASTKQDTGLISPSACPLSALWACKTH